MPDPLFTRQDVETPRGTETPPPPPADPPGPSKEGTKFDWNNPASSIAEAVREQGVSRAEFNRLSESLRRSGVEGARLACKDKHPDWHAWEPAVLGIMEKMDESLRSDPSVWESAYTFAKGMAFDTEVQRLRATGISTTTVGAETVNPPPVVTPNTPVELTPTENSICEGLGLTPEEFAKGKERMREGKWPLTMDNRRRR